jgi:hypothetical protein
MEPTDVQSATYSGADDIQPINKIFERDVKDIFYSKSKNQFYTKYKKQSVHNLKPLIWTEIKRVYKSKKNGETVFVNRYVSIPYEGTYVRLSEKEWLKNLE